MNTCEEYPRSLWPAPQNMPNTMTSAFSSFCKSPSFVTISKASRHDHAPGRRVITSASLNRITKSGFGTKVVPSCGSKRSFAAGGKMLANGGIREPLSIGGRAFLHQKHDRQLSPNLAQGLRHQGSRSSKSGKRGGVNFRMASCQMFTASL